MLKRNDTWNLLWTQFIKLDDNYDWIMYNNTKWCKWLYKFMILDNKHIEWSDKNKYKCYELILRS